MQFAPDTELHIKKPTKPKQTVLAVVFLLIVSLLLLTGCEGNSLKSAARAAYQAAGRPADVDSMYVYHFRGLDRLNAHTGTTLAEAFDIETHQVPENGYLFLVNGKYYILMDERCTLVKSINIKVLENSAKTNEQLGAWSKQVNLDYEAGKMTHDELMVQKNLILEAMDKSIEIYTQCERLAGCGLALITIGDPYDKDVINTAHELTPKLIRSLQ